MIRTGPTPAGAGTLLAALVARREALRHVRVPPDAVHLEVAPALVDDRVPLLGLELDHVAGLEGRALALGLQHRFALDGDEDLVLVVGVLGRGGAGSDHAPRALEGRVERGPRQQALRLE